MRSISLAACALLSLLSHATVSAEGSRAECGIFEESGGYARFRLQSGRLVLDPIQYRKGTHKRHVDGRSETIVISSVRGVPSLHYTSEDAYQRLQMVAEHGKSLRIESTLRSTGEVGVYVQSTGQPIQWSTIRASEAPVDLNQSVSGKTLLHIVGQDEAGFQVHLESLMSRMLRGRSVLEMSLQTHRYLCENVTTLPSVTLQQMENLVDDLQHPAIAQAAAKHLADSLNWGVSRIPIWRAH